MEFIHTQLARAIQNYLDLLEAGFREWGVHFVIKGGWNGVIPEQEFYMGVIGRCWASPETREPQEWNMLDIQINYECRQVQVTNLRPTMFMRKADAAMKLLHIVQQTAGREGYEVFMVGASEPLYQLLLSRGALPCSASVDRDGQMSQCVRVASLPPAAWLLSPFHPQLEALIRQYAAILEEKYAENALVCKIICIEQGDGVWCIEAKGSCKEVKTSDATTDFVLLRMFVNYPYWQVQISNIFLPRFMRYRNVGKELIYHIFMTAEWELAKVYLVDMVPSFYERMIRRGAKPCTKYVGDERVETDAVQITRDTDLSWNPPKQDM